MSQSVIRRCVVRVASVPLPVAGLCLPYSSASATPVSGETIPAGIDELVNVKLVPGWLPPGYEELNNEVQTVPGAYGNVTFVTTRYSELQPDGSAVSGVIYL